MTQRRRRDDKSGMKYGVIFQNGVIIRPQSKYLQRAGVTAERHRLGNVFQ